MHRKDFPMNRPENLWDARFAWFWYNDEEIFHDTDTDLERKAKAMAKLDINYAITFSCTHFRWSFYHYWDMLNDVLARIVKVFHKHDIRVIEHHSAVLTHGSVDKEGYDYMSRMLKKRKSSIESWPKLIGGLKQGPVILDGKKLSDFYQRKGETGMPINNGYHGYQICVNNPYYLRAYLGYLENVYATGVDGIMTDDVSYAYYGCACEFCQRKFREQSGYEFPAAEDWKAWRHKPEEPSFRAFLDFKRKSVEDFHIAVKKHYESLGLRLLRPNYSAHCFYPYSTTYCLQKLPALDWVFQEAGGGHIMEYSWPSWSPEAAHRFSVGRFRNIPSMLMTYPTRDSNLKLSWALAMSWGQLYTGTSDGSEGFEMPVCEKPLRDFECQHKNLLLKPEKFAHLGFYDSHRARELNFEYEEKVYPQLMSWLMACAMSNVPFDVFSTEELTERLSTYDTIVLTGVKYLSGWELNEIRHFLAGGGTIILTGETGRFDCSYNPYDSAKIADLLNCPGFVFPEDSDGIKTFPSAKGRLITCGSKYLIADYEPEYRLGWWSNDITKDLTIPFKRLTEQDLETRREIVKLLKSLMLNGPDMLIENLPEGVLATTFLNNERNAVVIHLVNASGIFDKQDNTPLSYFDEDSVPFPSHKGKMPVLITLRKPDTLNNITIQTATWHDLYNHSESLPTTDSENHIQVTIPPEMIKDYGLIELSFNSRNIEG